MVGPAAAGHAVGGEAADDVRSEVFDHWSLVRLTRHRFAMPKQGPTTKHPA